MRPVRSHESLRARGSRRARVLAWTGALAALATGTLIASAPAATSSLVVTLDVASATELDISSCPIGDPQRTMLGTTLPGSTGTTTDDCEVVFGSTNDTARLELLQRDGAGVAMYAPHYDELDTSFAGDGVYTGPESGELAEAVAIDDQYRVTVLGRAEPGSSIRAGAWRFLPDGSLDPAFGITSTGYTEVNPTSHGNDSADDGIVEADGTLTMVGYGYSNSTTASSYVLRMDADGTPLASFGGGDGLVDISAPASYLHLERIVDHPAGGWVASGYLKYDATDRQFAVARIRANGSLDPSFGNAGVAEFNRGTVGAGYEYENTEDVAVLSDGRIVVTGRAGSTATTGRWITLAFTAAGVLDTTGWNAPNGYWESSIASSHTGNAIVEQPDGKVVVGGTFRPDANTRLTAIRHDPDGTLDGSFGGGDGIASDGFGGASFERTDDIELQADGTLLLMGRLDGLSSGGPNQIGFVRLLANGDLDPSFGTSGTIEIPGEAGNEDPRAMDIVDGSVAVVGAGGNDLRVWRTRSDTIPDFEPGTFDWSTSDTSHFGACLRELAGSNVAAGAGWAVDPGNDCAASNADAWRPIARREGETTATVATTTVSTTTGATVRLRFGARTSLAQPPGAYEAPLTFQVVAPS